MVRSTIHLLAGPPPATLPSPRTGRKTPTPFPLLMRIDEWGHRHLPLWARPLVWWPFCDAVEVRLGGLPVGRVAGERLATWKAWACG